jgi:hypothetical protein
MRIEALALAALSSLASTAHADGIRLRLERPEGPLVEGAREELRAIVAFDAPNDRPLLVTPESEGPAVEVVRGRLLRSDADDAAAPELVFRIPIVARAVGTATVRVRVRGYVCARRCRSVIATGEATLRVERAPEPSEKSAMARDPSTLYTRPVCRAPSRTPSINGWRLTSSSTKRSRSRPSGSSKRTRRARSSGTRAPT